jgi:inner membrane protein
MAWWLWILLGLALLFLEAVSPGGLFFLFFGLSGLVVGILVLAGLGGAVWVQWGLFSVIAVIALVLLRGPLKARLDVKGSQRPVDSLVGEGAVVLEEIPASGVGKAEVRGSSWNARSAGGAVLAKGQRCRIERIDGLTVWVRPE